MASVNQTNLQILLTQNQLIPDEGPRSIPLPLDFTANGSYVLDLEPLQTQGFFSMVQTVFIDMSGSAVPLTLQITGGGGQTIVAKANTQGYYTILCPNPARMIFTCVGGPAMTAYLCNFAIPGSVWPTA